MSGKYPCKYVYICKCKTYQRLFTFHTSKGIWDIGKKIGIREMRAEMKGIGEMRAEMKGIREMRAEMKGIREMKGPVSPPPPPY